MNEHFVHAAAVHVGNLEAMAGECKMVALARNALELCQNQAALPLRCYGFEPSFIWALRERLEARKTKSQNERQIYEPGCMQNKRLGSVSGTQRNAEAH
jgi:hypothetical protein